MFTYKFLSLNLLLISIEISQSKPPHANEPTPDETTTPYLVNLPNCAIPSFPYLNEAILPEWNKPFKSNCPSKERIATITRDEKLIISNVDSYKNCCYTEILRPQMLKSDKYELSPSCTPITITSQIDVSTLEFLVLYCETHNSSIETEFHYNFPITNPTLSNKLNYWKEYKKELFPFSVKFLIVDSLSRAHAHRSLPKTIKYLKEELNFIDFKAYHAMGEPTIENYIPMMLGFVTSEQKWTKKKPFYAGKYDNEPFIWKNYSSLNYITMDVEDMAYWHTFHFNGRTGFTQRQMDYNTRPYFLMQEEFSPKTKFNLKYGIKNPKTFSYKALNCIDGKNVYNFLLDYTKEFELKFKNVPKFSITWWGWPNHDFLPATQLFDEPILDYFNEMDEKILDTTIHFLIGDHGFRWSNYSETKYGLLERDLPFFLIRLPPKFIELYPEAHTNLLINSNRLSSHVDFFKTLVDIHQKMRKLIKSDDKDNNDNSSYGYNYSYGQSLFTEIPINRTCKDAKIPEQFCSCNFPLFDEPFDYEKYSKTPAVEGLSAIKN